MWISEASANPMLDQQTQQLLSFAHTLGFSSAAAIPAVPAQGFAKLQEWIARGYAGTMDYIPRRLAAYEHPSGVAHGARSLVMLSMNYRTAEPAAVGLGEGRVSRYAWSDVDYHDLIRERLRKLADHARQLFSGCHARGIVDTAPLLERDYARLAGLGWIGKHTLLLNQDQGSWFFLAALILDVELSYSAEEVADHCGTCTACLDACPTHAFPQPHVLDASRCISYLTIEHRGEIARELRAEMGNWVFGCDVCQDVCPWNRKSPQAVESRFSPLRTRNPLQLCELFFWEPAQFEQEFRGSPIHRPGRVGLLRNAAIALGNFPSATSIPALSRGLNDVDPIIREACAWALGQHGQWSAAMEALKHRTHSEDVPIVCHSIRAAIDAIQLETGPSTAMRDSETSFKLEIRNED